MDIGEKIKNLRLKLGLTQEELANRAELSKGFISQLERNLTSPSIVTLIDILECLGTTPGEFFSEKASEKISFTEADMFEKEDEEKIIKWLVPNAQKNEIEPIIITVFPGCSSEPDDPHEGEEFGYVLAGTGILHLGSQKIKIKKGVSFYYKSNETHYLENRGVKNLEVIWVSSPPSF